MCNEQRQFTVYCVGRVPLFKLWKEERGRVALYSNNCPRRRLICSFSRDCVWNVRRSLDAAKQAMIRRHVDRRWKGQFTLKPHEWRPLDEFCQSRTTDSQFYFVSCEKSHNRSHSIRTNFDMREWITAEQMHLTWHELRFSLSPPMRSFVKSLFHAFKYLLFTICREQNCWRSFKSNFSASSATRESVQRNKLRQKSVVEWKCSTELWSFNTETFRRRKSRFSCHLTLTWRGNNKVSRKTFTFSLRLFSFSSSFASDLQKLKL